MPFTAETLSNARNAQTLANALREERRQALLERNRLVSVNRDLRAALQGCRDWVANCPDMRDGAGTAASQQRYVLAEIDAALALADAAGKEGG